MDDLTNKKSSHKSRRVLLVCLGILFLGLAYIGIVLPGFPAIPFILIALFLFANSSDTLYKLMLRQRIFKNLLDKTNAKKKNIWFRIFIISQLWVSVTVAIILFVDSYLWAGIIIIAGVMFSFVTYRLMEWLQE